MQWINFCWINVNYNDIVVALCWYKLWKNVNSAQTNCFFDLYAKTHTMGDFNINL